MEASSGLPRSDEGATQKMQELECLIWRQPIAHKRGPIEDEICKLLVYGDRKLPGTQVRIEKVMQALGIRRRREKKEGNPRRRIT